MTLREGLTPCSQASSASQPLPTHATLTDGLPSPGTLPQGGQSSSEKPPAQCHTPLLLPFSGPLRLQGPECLPPQTLTAALRAPRPRSPTPNSSPLPQTWGHRSLSARAGSPDSPVPTRSPRPATRGGGEGAEKHPLRRQVPGDSPAPIWTGAGLPPRAGRHSRAGAEVPPHPLPAGRRAKTAPWGLARTSGGFAGG